MRTTAHLAAALVAAALLSACRDEQAGPRDRPLPPSAAPATGRTLQAVPGDLTFQSSGTWAGGTIRYLGSKVDPVRPRPGQPVQLTHYFQALKPPPAGGSLLSLVLCDSVGDQRSPIPGVGLGALPVL